MELRETDQVLNYEEHLAPGFLVTIAGPMLVKFPHLRDAAVRRAQPGMVELVGELSRARGRTIGALIDEVASRADADRETLVHFVDQLRQAGQLQSVPAAARYSAVTPAALEPTGQIPLDEPLAIQTPATFLVEDGDFLWFDHDGVLRARLMIDEVLAVRAFGRPRSVQQAWALHKKRDSSATRPAFDGLVSRLAEAGLLRTAPTSAAQPTDKVKAPSATPTRTVVEEATTAAVQAQREKAAKRAGDRLPLVPVNTIHTVAPLSLALLVAHAQEWEGGRLQERYDFVPQFLADLDTLLELALTPSVFLFSHYVWNVDDQLHLSALIKHVNPENITVHGGPSTPKYEKDVEEFFAKHDHVDIAVHGEGETTFVELLDALDPQRPGDLGQLGDVAGLSYRSAAGPVRTCDRERIAELDTIPSPYLLGLMDSFGAAQAGAIIETNRGCPYGCTFCDWGSATLSRIRQFSLDRVFAELEWSARNQIDIASIADANFGIIERDVAIAQKIADLKREYGYPRTVAVNYAKNTIKHLRQIIEIFADVEILTEGVVSLQSMDQTTLKIIRRSNIKLEKYNELSTEFRRSRLPLAADIMMGLPGSTPAAFRNDLQECTNRDVRVRANPTQLLPNSPMNEPSYRDEHGITASPGEFVMESSTFTRAEWQDMNGLRLAYYIFDNWGVLRFVARFIRQETGLHEVDFYDRVRRDAAGEPSEWPLIRTVLDVLETFMAPPASWGLFIAEVHDYLTTRLGIADDSALQTALEVQRAHLPAPDRTFPHTIDLPHDFVSWQDGVLAAREGGHRDDWELVVPRLGSFPPSSLTISDPNDICHADVGKPMGALAFALRSWELDSPVARPRLGALTTV